MMTYLKYTQIIFVFFGIVSFIQPGWGEETIWLRGTFKEIGSASPVIGHATFPLDLTKAIIEATPVTFLEEAEKSGFNVDAIFEAVSAMPVGESFEFLNNNDLHLHIEKFSEETVEYNLPKLLLIKMESPEGKTNIPVPLALTSTAIPLLQLALEELEGMEAQLGKMLDVVKQTKPGVLVVGEDRLMNSLLEIKLQ